MLSAHIAARPMGHVARYTGCRLNRATLAVQLNKLSLTHGIPNPDEHSVEDAFVTMCHGHASVLRDIILT